MDNEILIKNGMVLDGTGTPAVRADVIVRGDRVEDVGSFPDAQADSVIDAQGLAVAPGFIDAHTHLDFFVASPKHPQVMERWARQGVTTIVAGNCGFSPAPIRESAKGPMSTYVDFAFPKEGLDLPWCSMKEYFDLLESNGQAFNVAVFAGHNTLRASVMGYHARFAQSDEIDEMKKMLKSAMDEGACGFSIGLFYLPGVFSKTDELVEIASVLKDSGAPIAVHTRGLTQVYHKAVEEAIHIAETNSIPLQLSHHAGGDPSKKKSTLLSYDFKQKVQLALLRMMGQKFFYKMAIEKNWVYQDAVKAINAAMDRGVAIGHDNMPWMCGPSTILCLFPPWLFDGGLEKGFERLEDPAIRQQVIHELKTVTPKWPTWEHGYWTDNFFTPSVKVSGLRQEKNKRYENLFVKEIVKLQQKDPYELLVDLVLEERGKFSLIGGLWDDPAGDDLMAHLLADPNCSIMTDVVGIDHPAPNPVPYGAFTKVLGYFARDRGIFSQEEAIRRMTSLPAKQMQLKDRGLLRKGAFADITVFNPKTVKNCASFKDPHRFSEGIEHVLINGKPVLDGGIYDAKALAGTVIKRT